MNIQGVVFDLDGLLVNTEELYQEVGAEILSRRGHTFDDDLLDAMMGRPPEIALQTMIDWHHLDDSVEGLASETSAIFQGLLDTRLELMPGVKHLLDYLMVSDIPCGVATSSGPDFAQDVLCRVEIRKFFRFVLTSADVERGKPNPEIYITAADRLGIEPKHMLVLEDSAAGCAAAVAAGAVTVAVPSGQSRRHDFTGAHCIASSLADPKIVRVLTEEKHRSCEANHESH
ncbi:MAG: HAD-IA family hydrolase [Pirellulales bacterium]